MCFNAAEIDRILLDENLAGVGIDLRRGLEFSESRDVWKIEPEASRELNKRVSSRLDCTTEKLAKLTRKVKNMVGYRNIMEAHQRYHQKIGTKV